MSFFTLGQLRTILTTETDADSPLSEELMSQLRENFEAILILLFGTNISGSATSDPPNDTTGYLTDTASAWTDDLHNGRTVLITSGLAIGNMYTIDDTVASTDRLVCTGDNLYSDGVRSGDAYLILYDLKTNWTGHDHDGVNSKWVRNQPTIAADTVCLAHSNINSSVQHQIETYTKKAEAYIAQDGELRIKFSLKAENDTAYGRIYRNGVAVGTEQSTSGTQTFSEDIAGWSAGDLCQMYTKIGSSFYYVELSKFEIWANLDSSTKINPL